MANVHVLTQSGGRLRIVFHVAIPNANNPRGVNYRTALVQMGQYGTTILPDGDGTAGTISAAERTQISSRAVVEVVRDIKRAGLTAQALDELFAQCTADTQAEVQDMFAHYGVIR